MLREISDKVDSTDLSQYDLSRFQPMSFEFEPKSAALTMRLSDEVTAKKDGLTLNQGGKVRSSKAQAQPHGGAMAAAFAKLKQ